MTDLLITSTRVVLPDGTRPATVGVRAGRIVSIAGAADRPAGVPIIDAGSHVVLPGLVDTHVHLNDPGRADWEGFDSGTRAAAAGGVTTLVDMPLNSIPATTTAAALEAKRRAADGRCHVDVEFWGGVVPGNAGEIDGLARAGVRGFKCFLSPSGVDEFPHVAEADLRTAMPVVAATGLPLLVHAELPAFLRKPGPRSNRRRYKTWLGSRPADAEHAAIDLMIRLAREFGTRVHIVHLATADVIPQIWAARNEGVEITVETCPHYLTFAAEQIGEGATAFKCAPPIRGEAQRERLWQSLLAGDIDLVASDHSPAPPAMKQLDTGDFLEAWGGIASLQLGLSVMWTEGEPRGVTFDQLARWMAAAPARLAGLEDRKGAIAVGRDADLIVFDPDAVFTVDGAALSHRHPITPYHGLDLRGAVRTTLRRGEVIYQATTA